MSEYVDRQHQDTANEVFLHTCMHHIHHIVKELEREKSLAHYVLHNGKSEPAVWLRHLDVIHR